MDRASTALPDARLRITNWRATPGTRTFLQLDHVRDRRVFVNYDMSGAAVAIAPPGRNFEQQIGVAVVKPKQAPAVSMP